MEPPDPQPDRADPEAIRRNLAHALPAIIYSATPELRMEFVNWRAIEHFGIDPDELGHRHWIDRIHPDDRASVMAAWDIALAAAQPYKHEHRILHSDGHYGRYHAEALPLLDEHGAVLRWYGVVTPLIQGEPLRVHRPRHRPDRVDIYPFRDTSGMLQLVEVAAWDDRPDDPGAKLHPSGFWYRIEPV